MTEPKSTDRSALVGRLRMKADIIEMGEKIAWGSDSAIMREAADFIESPQGLTENIAEQLDLLVACAKPASGQHSARVAAGLVRDYIADLIRERDEARVAQSSPPAGEIQGLVERLRAREHATDRDSPIMAHWDMIRHLLLTERDDGDQPRLIFESVIEVITEDCLEAAEAITRLSQPSEKAKP